MNKKKKKKKNGKRKNNLKKITIIQGKTNYDYTYREKFCIQKYLPTLLPLQVSFAIFENKAPTNTKNTFLAYVIFAKRPH